MKKSTILLIAIFAFISLSAAYQPQFSIAGFYPLDGTGRSAYSLNIAWRFVKTDVQNAEAADFDDSKWQVVSLPHGLEYLPAEASGGVNYQGPAWYRKHFTPDETLKGKKLFLHFEAIMGKSKVWVNGKLVTEHFGGYLPVIADITNELRWGKDNVIAVRADNSDDPIYPPGKAQSVLDFCYFGGIYRDCWLIATNGVHITDPNYENETAGGGVFVSFDKVSEKSAIINLKTHIRNEQTGTFAAELIYQLKQADEKCIASSTQNLNIQASSATSSFATLEVKSPKLWSPESPYLYWLYVYVKDRQGKIIDGYKQRIGIRSIEFKEKDGLWLNGKPYEDKLIGVNRHQDFAVVGNALTNNMHWRDAKKMRDAGMKVIRSAHYLQDPAFLDACDELGLFVIINNPGWQFWNDAPVFAQRVYNDIRNMVRRDRNRASFFFWEPILNETSYPADFAKNAVEIVKREYPYPYSTSACDDGADGAEYFSLLLRPRIKLDSTKTYFVREWGDNVDDWSAQNSDSRVDRSWGETPMLLQAKHYAKPDYRVICLESLYKNPRQIVGGCLWHSFDHQRGYHPDPQFAGIMDAFRQPKTSYFMFMSQRSPFKSDLLAETGPMVHIANDMTPFSPSDVTVYSNCDEVRLTFLKNGKQQTYKKDHSLMGMPSPVISFKNTFDFMACKARARAGKQDEVYLLAEGLMNGKVVATHKICPAERVDHIRLRLYTDGVDLIANGSDVVTVIAEMMDKNGNIKRLNNNSIRFSIEGEGRLISEDNTKQYTQKISWGSAPALVQSTTKAGKIRITASVVREGSQTPVGGELVFYSVNNTTPSIFNPEEVKQIDKLQIQTVRNEVSKSELELENEKLRKQLNELKIKEVEKQQNKFGIGIN